VDFTKQSPVIISLCPGIRGIERGLERIFREVRACAYVEIEAFIVENLLAAMEAGLVAPAPIWTNLKTFNPEPFRGLIDGIIGGYPCQPFSLAGNRAGENDPRHLWPFIREHVRTIKPGWCFFENVAGHLTLGFDVVKRELEEMDYFVEAGIYSAEEIGAPQRRERLFILAIRVANSAEPGLPEPRPTRVGKLPTQRGEGMDDRLEQQGFELGDPCDNTTRRDITGESKRVRMGVERDCLLHGRRNEEKYISDSPSTELANTRLLRQKECQEQTARTEQCSEELANTNNDGSTAPKDGQSDRQGDERNKTGQEQLLKYEGCSSVRRDEELADTSNQRLQGGELAGTFRLKGKATPQSATECCRYEHRFPAGQGIYQHEWEEPRTVESSVEYSINGYNFTEDLHRAIGNSVVEQTAELAFWDLWRKAKEWNEFVNG